MSILQFVLTALVCGGGAFVQRVTGFGMGIFAMLFLPYFLPSQGMAAAVIGLVNCVGSMYNAVRHREQIRLRLMLPMVGTAMVLIPLAVYLSASLPQSVLKRLLGVVLVALSIWFLFFSKRIHMKPTVVNGMAAGAVSGMLNGMFTTGGPPAVLYLIHATSDKNVYFATLQAFFASTNAFSTVNRALNGLITLPVLILAALSLAGWALGNALGCRVFEKLDADRIRNIVYYGMIVSGVLMIVQA